MIKMFATLLNGKLQRIQTIVLSVKISVYLVSYRFFYQTYHDELCTNCSDTQSCQLSTNRQSIRTGKTTHNLNIIGGKSYFSFCVTCF